MFEANAPLPMVGDDPLPETKSFPTAENFVDANTPDVGRPTTFEAIEAACAECLAFGDGEGFFDSRWHKRIDELLVPSFHLFSGIGDDEALLAFVIAKTGLKTTKATRSNPPLVCVQITARPHDTHQRKLCSGWALILNEARAANIPAEGFAEWVKGRDRKTSLAPVAIKRAESRDAGDKSQPEVGHETLTLLASVHTEVVDAMTMPGSQVERLRRLAKVFQDLADGLAAQETNSEAGVPNTNETTAEAADA